MTTFLINQQNKHPIHRSNLQTLTDWLGEKLQALTAPDTWSEVTVILTDDEGITQPNREFFAKDRPTDVISFRYDPVPGEEPAFSGDLLVNVERAHQEGSARGSIDRELAFYIAHGVDHLSGAEDDTEEKRAQMHVTENAWLDEAAAAGLLDGLLEG